MRESSANGGKAGALNIVFLADVSNLLCYYVCIPSPMFVSLRPTGRYVSGEANFSLVDIPFWYNGRDLVKPPTWHVRESSRRAKHVRQHSFVERVRRDPQPQPCGG